MLVSRRKAGLRSLFTQAGQMSSIQFCTQAIANFHKNVFGWVWRFGICVLSIGFQFCLFCSWRLHFLCQPFAVLFGSDCFSMQAWCCFALCDFSYTLDTASIYLTDEQRSRAVESGYQFLQGYLQLAWENLQAARCSHKVRPKLHLFRHILYSLDQIKERLNPRLWSCFNDESVIGRWGKISKVLKPLLAANRSLQRWVLGLNRHAK